MSDTQHQDRKLISVPCAVITVSDTRTVDTDKSGRLICDLLTQAGHSIHVYEIVPDEPDRVSITVTRFCREPACRAVLLTGGTGLAPRDTTHEAVAALLEKRLDGFGELFRTLSYAQIGAAAMLSRALAGVCNATAVFSMPGSVEAVELAMEKLIVPQLGHVCALLRDE